MVRILHITGSLRRNGTETFIMNVFRSIDRTKFSFDFLLTSHTEEGFEQEAKDLGARIFYYTPRAKSLVGHRKSLKEFFKHHAAEYAAIHYSGNSFSEILPITLAKKYGVPVRIAHCHNISTSGLHNRIFHAVNRTRLNQVATHFFACSEQAKVNGFKGTPALHKANVIVNGIDLKRFHFNPDVRQKLRDQLGLKPEELIIGNVAAFREAKNHRFMLEIMKEILSINSRSKLLLAGEGPLKTEMMALASELGIQNNVIFLGSRDDVPQLLQAMDIFLFPSKYEGLGISLIEAQAAGLPVYTSSNIPKETQVTPLIKYVPLDLSPQKWAKMILETDTSHDRTQEYEKLKMYDINNTVSTLSRIYNGEGAD